MQARDTAIRNVTLEQVEELYKLLVDGETPIGYEIPVSRKLSRRQAYCIIWFLQERMRLLPDHFELCQLCHHWFDSEEEGHTGDAGKWCDTCMPGNNEIDRRERRADRRRIAIDKENKDATDRT